MPHVEMLSSLFCDAWAQSTMFVYGSTLHDIYGLSDSDWNVAIKDLKVFYDYWSNVAGETGSCSFLD